MGGHLLLMLQDLWKMDSRPGCRLLVILLFVLLFGVPLLLVFASR